MIKFRETNTSLNCFHQQTQDETIKYFQQFHFRWDPGVHVTSQLSCHFVTKINFSPKLKYYLGLLRDSESPIIFNLLLLLDCIIQ